MINPTLFYKSLVDLGVNFFTGVPDSLLKEVCGVITDSSTDENHIISANEGSALSIAVGYNLATGKLPLVYLQNSGLGNLINPLLSLADKKVYSIPMVIMIGWRGEPNVHDEPQHVKQGEVMLPMLDSMGYGYTILSEEDDDATYQEKLKILISQSIQQSEPVFLVIKKNVFSKYKLQKDVVSVSDLTREETIVEILNTYHQDEIFVTTTGMISREVYETRLKANQGHSRDFLTVGSMGHASQIALGISLQTNRNVICIDGDGSFLMHMGGASTIGQFAKDNYIHFILNNGSHDSVGGQPTLAQKISLKDIAKACGYKNYFRLSCRSELENFLTTNSNLSGPVFVEIIVKKGNRSDLGRPKSKPIDNKIEFQKFVRALEN